MSLNDFSSSHYHFNQNNKTQNTLQTLENKVVRGSSVFQ